MKGNKISDQFNKAAQIAINNDWLNAMDAGNLAKTSTSNLEFHIHKKCILLSNCIKVSNILILTSTDEEVIPFQYVLLDAATAIN